MTFLPCDDVSYGDEITRLIDHTTITTIDRLLLPELLPDVDRLTYVDIDALVLGDITELATIDLGGHPLAARTSHRLATQVWHSVGALLPHERAFEFWHETSARHPFGYQTFNAGVLVLDLSRMRADRFSHTFLPWVGWYGLNDQDALLAYAGPGRAELPAKWNSWPVLEPLDVTSDRALPRRGQTMGGGAHLRLGLLVGVQTRRSRPRREGAARSA